MIYLIIDILSASIGSFMDIKKAQPVMIRFKNPKEAVDLYISIELKYFLAKLFITHPLI